MKSLKKVLLIFIASTIMITQSGCFGSFELTKSLYEVNKNVGDEVVNELVFLALIIIPVYEICAFVDVIVINSIEFWTGTNPLAMNDGDMEIQQVKSGEKLYQITATKNKFNIQQLEGPDAGEYIDLVYNPESKIWSVGNDEVNYDILQALDGGNQVKVFAPFGMHSTIDLTKLNNQMLLKNV